MDLPKRSDVPPAAPQGLVRASRAGLARRAATAVGLCYLAFVAAYAVGFSLARPAGGSLGDARGATREALSSADRFGNLRSILATNAIAALGIAALGTLSRGILSLASVTLFGFWTGMTSGALHGLGFPGGFLAAYHLTHGVLEVLGLSIAGAAGFAGGVAFSLYLKTGSLPGRAELRSVGLSLALSLAVLVAAAAIEAYVTPGIALSYLE
ncbi:MAG: stage II sporulation protein M [Planctomycetes bacterium]|nr:stage II sporulation protein M [Planctomycetota bacterium]